MAKSRSLLLLAISFASVCHTIFGHTMILQSPGITTYRVPFRDQRINIAAQPRVFTPGRVAVVGYVPTAQRIISPSQPIFIQPPRANIISFTSGASASAAAAAAASAQARAAAQVAAANAAAQARAQANAAAAAARARATAEATAAASAAAQARATAQANAASAAAQARAAAQANAAATAAAQANVRTNIATTAGRQTASQLLINQQNNIQQAIVQAAAQQQAAAAAAAAAASGQAATHQAAQIQQANALAQAQQAAQQALATAAAEKRRADTASAMLQAQQRAAAVDQLSHARHRITTGRRLPTIPGSRSIISSSNLGIRGSNLGISGSNLGISGSNLGIRGPNLGISGSNLGIRGSNLGIRGSIPIGGQRNILQQFISQRGTFEPAEFARFGSLGSTSLLGLTGSASLFTLKERLDIFKSALSDSSRIKVFIGSQPYVTYKGFYLTYNSANNAVTALQRLPATAASTIRILTGIEASILTRQLEVQINLQDQLGSQLGLGNILGLSQGSILGGAGSRIRTAVTGLGPATGLGPIAGLGSAAGLGPIAGLGPVPGLGPVAGLGPIAGLGQTSRAIYPTITSLGGIGSSLGQGGVSQDLFDSNIGAGTRSAANIGTSLGAAGTPQGLDLSISTTIQGTGAGPLPSTSLGAAQSQTLNPDLLSILLAEQSSSPSALDLGLGSAEPVNTMGSLASGPLGTGSVGFGPVSNGPFGVGLDSVLSSLEAQFDNPLGQVSAVDPGFVDVLGTSSLPDLIQMSSYDPSILKDLLDSPMQNYDYPLAASQPFSSPPSSMNSPGLDRPLGMPTAADLSPGLPIQEVGVAPVDNNVLSTGIGSSSLPLASPAQGTSRAFSFPTTNYLKSKSGKRKAY